MGTPSRKNFRADFALCVCGQGTPCFGAKTKASRKIRGLQGDDHPAVARRGKAGIRAPTKAGDLSARQYRHDAQGRVGKTVTQKIAARPVSRPIKKKGICVHPEEAPHPGFIYIADSIKDTNLQTVGPSPMDQRVIFRARRGNHRVFISNC